ncbi:hypothetical protein CTI12_AA136260 [Artemisia annua]|uniref:Uncharacterized protein n=1 Tax=Artemisia annua TaxID=35608 RepID=A0A2U1PMQ8_ARTAN|nr:hypothetical protein CTI12_AA136260 [Artemisia annua]
MPILLKNNYELNTSLMHLLKSLILLFHFYRVERVTKVRVITVIIVVLSCLMLLYLFVTAILVDTSHLPAKQLGMDRMYVEFETNEDLVLLDANVTLRVTFEEKGSLKLSPKLATFNLSSYFGNHHLISAVSTSTFKITEDEQVMVLRFKHQTHLTKEEMRVFQEMLHERILWITLSGDFKWHVKHARSLGFGNSYGHTQFSCDFMYTDLLKNDLHWAVCDRKQ